MNKVDLVLIAGLWLPRQVWDPVVAELARAGHRARVVPLPGQDDDAADVVLDDQVAAVLGVVDECERPLVVGHSAAAGLAWIAADRRPDRVAGVVLVGGFPTADGTTYADFLDPQDGVVLFPGWDAFEGPDSADLDPDQRAALSASMSPVPAGVTRGVVQLTDDRRHSVPTLVVCPEFFPADVRAWLQAGDLPELSRIRDLSLVDLDSGHWPMVTRPAQLAEAITEWAARQ